MDCIVCIKITVRFYYTIFTGYSRERVLVLPRTVQKRKKRWTQITWLGRILLHYWFLVYIYYWQYPWSIPGSFGFIYYYVKNPTNSRIFSKLENIEQCCFHSLIVLFYHQILIFHLNDCYEIEIVVETNSNMSKLIFLNKTVPIIFLHLVVHFIPFFENVLPMTSWLDCLYSWIRLVMRNYSCNFGGCDIYVVHNPNMRSKSTYIPIGISRPSLLKRQFFLLIAKNPE